MVFRRFDLAAQVGGNVAEFHANAGAFTLGPKLIGARRRRVCKRFAAVGERLGRTGVLRALRKTHVELFLVCADLKIHRAVLGLDALGFRGRLAALLLHSIDKFCRTGVHNGQSD